MANLQIVPAGKNVEAQYVEMRVPLYSYGCERKVKKALSHLRGIYSVNVDFNEQKVTVWGICNKYDVLATTRKKRKEASFWNPEEIDKTEQSQSQSQSMPTSPSMPLRSMPSFTLARARSLSWKALKKVFIRSNSF
ncbi:Heavy metal-associated isoprenylated plant protein [Actinidia chinensis var. chinensis]|uniref:Heavy metal-associated isoprenylated plant protein n=1 Tax=Actinidia chinensis var. chinensis TaxID=1590841 RepID=A0A2R6RSE0_ACTCC|nr:copper transport protein ATX1-like [Actinidia eriantha]PSS32933.1 Heavy metal-associated isoprenylated plant protein [Actinidia chinensis var. chinensis]